MFTAPRRVGDFAGRGVRARSAACRRRRREFARRPPQPSAGNAAANVPATSASAFQFRTHNRDPAHSPQRVTSPDAARARRCNRRASWRILDATPELVLTANMSSPLPVMPIDGMPNDSGSTVRASGPIEPTDAQLVAGRCAGDATAFEALVRRHYRAAFSVALAHTGNHADAEDVCHDAFVRAAERLEDCRQPDRFAQWLCAIVRNRAHNVVARDRVRRASPLEPETAAEPRESGARRGAVGSARRGSLAALASLPAIQREVVLLHDLHGWSHEEIAGVIGTSSGMSRQHLFKARKRLRGSARRTQLGGFASMNDDSMNDDPIDLSALDPTRDARALHGDHVARSRATRCARARAALAAPPDVLAELAAWSRPALLAAAHRARASRCRRWRDPRRGASASAPARPRRRPRHSAELTELAATRRATPSLVQIARSARVGGWTRPVTTTTSTMITLIEQVCEGSRSSSSTFVVGGVGGVAVGSHVARVRERPRWRRWSRAGLARETPRRRGVRSDSLPARGAAALAAGRSSACTRSPDAGGRRPRAPWRAFAPTSPTSRTTCSPRCCACSRRRSRTGISRSCRRAAPNNVLIDKRFALVRSNQCEDVRRGETAALTRRGGSPVRRGTSPRRIMSRFLRAVLVAATCLPVAAQAQARHVIVRGRVTSDSGRAVSGADDQSHARVRQLMATARRPTRAATTRSIGRAPTSSYSLVVSAPGFQRYIGGSRARRRRLRDRRERRAPRAGRSASPRSCRKQRAR